VVVVMVLVKVRFSIPVCLEKLSIRSSNIRKIRISYQRVQGGNSDQQQNAALAKRSPAGSSGWSDMLSFEKEVEEDHGLLWQEYEIPLNFVFTTLVHITILEGSSAFVVIGRARFFGIKFDIFQQSSPRPPQTTTTN